MSRSPATTRQGRSARRASAWDAEWAPRDLPRARKWRASMPARWRRQDSKSSRLAALGLSTSSLPAGKVHGPARAAFQMACRGRGPRPNSLSIPGTTTSPARPMWKKERSGCS